MNKVNNKALKSLAPTSIAGNINDYRDYINDALNEKEDIIVDNLDKDIPYIKNKNKNIAITGNYGSGKSSIVKTFFNDIKYKDEVQYVTLGNYVADDYNQMDLDEIQICILQQLIYSKKPEQLSLSRVDRIDKNKTKLSIESNIIGGLITCIIGIIFYFKNYCSIIDCLLHAPWKIFVIILYGGLLFLLIMGLSYKLISKLSIKKIGFLENDIEFFNKNDLDSFNRYLDEFLNYFNENKKLKYLVFEDIDRLDESILVFSKLKEINSIINSYYNDRTIQFIYLLRDSVFETSENRSKFFDIIIPIVPFVGTITMKNKMISLFDDYQVDPNVIKVVAKYIDNIRELYDIYNEFSIYNKMHEKILISKSMKSSLLVLCVYKVMYPSKFKLYEMNKGRLAYYYSLDFQKEIDEHGSDKNSEIKKVKLPVEYKNAVDYNQLDFSNNDEFNKFEEEIIQHELLNRESRRLLYLKDDILTEEEIDILNKIQFNKSVNFDFKFKVRKEFIDELSTYDFDNDSICINVLFDFIIKTKNQELLERFYNYISTTKLDFFDQYNNDLVFNVSNDKIDYLVGGLLNSVKPIKSSIICRVLNKYKGRMLEERVKDIIQDSSIIFKYLEKYIQDCYDVLIDNKIVFNQKSIDKTYFRCIKIIYNKCLYGYNFRLLEGISNSGVIKDEFSFNSNKIIESFIKLHEDNFVRKFYSKDIDAFISNIINFGIQNDSEESLKIFINEFELNNELVTRILSNEDIKISDLSWVKPELYGYIYNSNKFIKNMNNLFILKKQLAGNFNLIEIINDNCDEVLKNTKNIEGYFEDIYYYFLSDSAVYLKSYEMIVDALNDKNYVLNKIPSDANDNFPVDKINLLMKFNNYDLSIQSINKLLSTNIIDSISDNVTNYKHHFIDCIKDTIDENSFIHFDIDSIKYVINKKLYDNNKTVTLISINLSKMINELDTIINYLLGCDIVSDLDFIKAIVHNNIIDKGKRIKLAFKYKKSIDNIFEYIGNEINTSINKKIILPKMEISKEDKEFLKSIGITVRNTKDNMFIYYSE